MIYTDGIHVITDQVDLTELHEFARTKLGFPLRWFQDKPGRPHYDTMALSKKLAALAGGAKTVTSRRIVEILKERQQKIFPDGGPWINESASVDITSFDALAACTAQIAAAFNVPVELLEPTHSHENRSPTNVELHLLPQYSGTTCHLCGRAYPATVLNIEAVIHHNAKEYTCINTTDCRRARRRRRRK